MLPPIKKVASVEVQYHCMSIIQKTIKFLNENQIPIDFLDQPVYAYSKEVQWRHPTTFGHGKYICLLGDLHIEQSILGLHVYLIKGSGLDSVLAHTNFSAIGTSIIVDGNNVKRSRCCLQVAICVIYQLLKEAHADSQSNLSLFDWLEKRFKTSQMAYYWRPILNFQIQVLVFVRSARTGNFLLYRETLFYYLKWFFVLDKYNYSRWATVYWFDLATLDQCCPDVFCNFMNRNFSFPKTNTLFSPNCS